MRIGAAPLLRIAKFAAVGATCFGVQVLILHWLHEPIGPTMANLIGFVTSAQLNFALSRYFTWGDVRRNGARWLAFGWVAFNANVVLASLLNSGSFFLAHRVLEAPLLLAAFCATALSTTSTFFVNHLVVFRPLKGVEHEHDTAELPHRVFPAGLQRSG